DAATDRFSILVGGQGVTGQSVDFVIVTVVTDVDPSPDMANAELFAVDDLVGDSDANEQEDLITSDELDILIGDQADDPDDTAMSSDAEESLTEPLTTTELPAASQYDGLDD